MTQAFLFFSFQLALPKTSVLLLCQHNSDFLSLLLITLCIVLPFAFCLLLLGQIALYPLEVYSFFYSLLFHSLSFGGSLRSFAMSVCFNSRFLTFLCIAFCPFAFCRLLFGHFALCPLEVYSFFYSMLFHSLSFGGSTRSFSMSVCFNSRFLTFFILFFAPLPLSFAFETFCALPFSILQTAFCPLLPPFVVFFLFCVWNSPFALLLTAICCKNLLLDKKFSKNKKSLEIVIKTFDNT